MSLLPVTLRKNETEMAYAAAKLSGELIPLSEEPSLQTYAYWKIINNRFPYDAVYKFHDMLVPKRIFENRTSMSMAELSELHNILSVLEQQYDVIFENTPSKRSVRGLFHIHLACYVDSRDDLIL